MLFRGFESARIREIRGSILFLLATVLTLIPIIAPAEFGSSESKRRPRTMAAAVSILALQDLAPVESDAARFDVGFHLQAPGC